MSDARMYGQTVWFQRDVEKFRELARDDPEEFLLRLETSGALMFAAQMTAAAEELRKRGMGVQKKQRRRRR
jgi:hypothetical protein